MRPYLLWLSTGAAGPYSNLLTPERLYDVFYHDYSQTGAMAVPMTRTSEYYLHEPGEKLHVAGRRMPPRWQQYHVIAFLDDDLSVTAADLNRLFIAGHTLRLPLFQPALTRGSYASHQFLREAMWDAAPFPGVYDMRYDIGVRRVPFVEVMCPFFSRAALRECLPTFDINQSGWGLDCYLWPKIVEQKCYVMDGIKVGHYRKPARRDRIMSNGLTPMQELWIQQVINDPGNAPVLPPGYNRPIIEEETA